MRAKNSIGRKMTKHFSSRFLSHLFSNAVIACNYTRIYIYNRQLNFLKILNEGKYLPSDKFQVNKMLELLHFSSSMLYSLIVLLQVCILAVALLLSVVYLARIAEFSFPNLNNKLAILPQ